MSRYRIGDRVMLSPRRGRAQPQTRCRGRIIGLGDERGTAAPDTVALVRTDQGRVIPVSTCRLAPLARHFRAPHRRLLAATTTPRDQQS